MKFENSHSLLYVDMEVCLPTRRGELLTRIVLLNFRTVIFANPTKLCPNLMLFASRCRGQKRCSWRENVRNVFIIFLSGRQS